MWPTPPLDTVVIEVRGSEGPVRAALSSCSEVLGAGRCQLTAAPSATSRPRWYAVVVFEDAELLRARVVLRPATAEAPLAERELEFSADDTLESRYRAVGLIAAAQVLAVAPELAGPAPASPPPPVRAAAPSVPEPARRFGLDAGAFGGPALDRGAPRLGILARPWFAPLRPLIAEASLRLSLRPDDPLVIWGAASLGLAVELTPESSAVSARARLALVVQRAAASTEDSETGERDSSATFQAGPELGADVSWPARSPVAAFAGGELGVPRPRLRVVVRERDAGQQASVVWSAGLGVRVAL